jgi:hypothetical protein
MPEEDIETAELKERIEEGVERALEEGGGIPHWTLYLSLTTAIIAVFAAVASLESGANSNDALLEKNEAVLDQAKASDAWSYFQAKGLKAFYAGNQSEMLASSNPALAEKLRQSAQHESAEQEELAKRARALEEKVAESNARAEHFLARHHRFAVSVTLFQVAIALCAIAALTRRKNLWFVGLVGGAIGIIIFGQGLLGAF